MKNTFRKHFMTKLLTLLFVFSSMVVFAAKNETVGRALSILRPDVKVQISATVERGGAKLSLEKAKAVQAGEALDWRISSANEGNASARNYQVVGQIPKGTIFVADSAKGEGDAKVSYSIDGGKTFSAQPLIDEKQADGSIKKVPAPVSMYTQLRFEWASELPVQSQFNAAYRVRVK
jgi:uncharacterized repeat protein (TIGR01451 family)